MNQLFKSKIIIYAFISILISSIIILIQGKLFRSKIYLGNIKKDFSAKIISPYNYKGISTNRKAKDCHSDPRKPLPDFSSFKRCFARKSNANKTIAFVGDSHTLSIFPISEWISEDYNANIFNHSRGNCAFPKHGNKQKNCFETMALVEEYLINIFSTQSNSLIITASNLPGYFTPSGTDNSKSFIYSDGTEISIKKNINQYIESLKNLLLILKDTNSKLVLFAPFPQHEFFLPEICLEQWFRPSWSINQSCKKTEKFIISKQRVWIMEELKKLEFQKDNFYIYEPAEKLCDNSFCFTMQDHKILYWDKDHISNLGNEYIYEDFIEFLKSKKLL